MKRKIFGIMFFVMLILSSLTVGVSAGSESDPEITDTIGDARTYLDIHKAWFYEDSSRPEMLYATIKLTQPNPLPFKQHLVVSWEMNGEHYASMVGIGYSFKQWFIYEAIIGRGQFGDPKPTVSGIEGSFDTTKGTVTFFIPKGAIGNPAPGDVLTNTKSECFERFGLWGRLGFSPFWRDIFFSMILDEYQLFDTAPDYLDGDVVYGRDYIIQY
jgi:hypothetical protein